MLMVAAIPVGARVATPRLTDVELYAWIAQAEAGEALVYHRGFLSPKRLVTKVSVSTGLGRPLTESTALTERSWRRRQGAIARNHNVQYHRLPL
jgi:hypothetical protein